MSPSHPVRGAEILAPKYLFATLTLCLGVALFAFNGFLVATVLPSAVDELDAAALIAWAESLYLIFAIVGGAGAAPIKARWGALTALEGAALVFLAGSVLAGSAAGMWQLLLGRMLQGLGEGFIAAVCYALIPDLFPPRLVPKVFGAEAVVWAGAAFGGPLVAGYLTEILSWRAAFLVNVPLSLVFALLAALIVPRGGDRQAAAGFPVLPLGAVAGGMLLVTFAGAADAVAAAALLACAAGLFVAAVRIDRGAVRLFPRGAFAFTQTVGLGFWVVLLMAMAHSAAAVYLVYAVEHLWGYAPTLAGALYALMAVCWSLTAIAVSGVGSRRARLNLIRLGPLLLLAGTAAIVLALACRAIAPLVLGQILVGGGFGTCWGYLAQGLMEAAPEEDRNRTSALVPTIQSAGYAIGAALMGLVANLAGFAGASSAGEMRRAVLAVFLLAAALAVPAVLAALRAVPLLAGAAGRPLGR